MKCSLKAFAWMLDVPCGRALAESTGRSSKHVALLARATLIDTRINEPTTTHLRRLLPAQIRLVLPLQVELSSLVLVGGVRRSHDGLARCSVGWQRGFGAGVGLLRRCWRLMQSGLVELINRYDVTRMQKRQDWWKSRRRNYLQCQTISRNDTANRFFARPLFFWVAPPSGLRSAYSSRRVGECRYST